MTFNLCKYWLTNRNISDSLTDLLIYVVTDLIGRIQQSRVKRDMGSLFVSQDHELWSTLAVIWRTYYFCENLKTQTKLVSKNVLLGSKVRKHLQASIKSFNKLLANATSFQKFLCCSDKLLTLETSASHTT